MKQFLVINLTLVFAITLSVSARADLVYHMVEYPAWQEGHPLTGTITTTNTAPADGILALSEILSWQWRTVGAWTQPGGFLATSNDYQFDTSSSLNVSITREAIYLDHIGELVLSREWPSGRGPFSHWLAWRRRSDGGGGWTDSYHSGEFLGDVLSYFWLQPQIHATESRWVIATYVPEPPSVSLAFAIGIPFFCRRIRRGIRFTQPLIG